jgi:hypothetical protein
MWLSILPQRVRDFGKYILQQEVAAATFHSGGAREYLFPRIFITTVPPCLGRHPFNWTFLWKMHAMNASNNGAVDPLKPLTARTKTSMPASFEPVHSTKHCPLAVMHSEFSKGAHLPWVYDGLELAHERGARGVVEALHRLRLRHVRPRHLHMGHHQSVGDTAVSLHTRRHRV